MSVNRPYRITLRRLTSGLALFLPLAIQGCTHANSPTTPKAQELFDLPVAQPGMGGDQWGGGLAWDGTGFWTRIGNQFCKLDKLGHKTSCVDFMDSSVAVSGCIEWDGSSLWTSARDSVYQLAPGTGEIMTRFPTPIPTGPTNEIVWDGVSLWIYGGGAPIVPRWYRVTPTGQILDSLPTLSLGNLGAAWDGRNVCCMTHPGRFVPQVYYSDFYRLTAAGGLFDQLRIEGIILEQLAYDGHDFYSIGRSVTGPYRLCRLVL